MVQVLLSELLMKMEWQGMQIKNIKLLNLFVSTPTVDSIIITEINKIAKNKKLLVLMAPHEPADAKKVASQTLVVKDKKVHPPLSTEKALDPVNGPLADYL